MRAIPSAARLISPLHEREGDDYIGCDPGNFEAEGMICEEFSLFDYGLPGGAELVRV